MASAGSQENERLQKATSVELVPASQTQSASQASPTSAFGISRAALFDLAQNANLEELKRHDGVKGLAKLLNSSITDGIEVSKVEMYQEEFGKNILPVKRVRWFIEHFVESLNDLTLIILMVAGVLTMIFGATISQTDSDIIQGGAILLAVAVVTGVTSVVNWMQDREFSSLSAMKEDREVTVVRDGSATRVSVFDVVVGDVLKVAPGEVVPVDGVLIRGNGILVNQSALTGESEQVQKSVKRDPFLLGGSTVDAGSGSILVIAVGSDASYGRIVAELQNAETPETPLQLKLNVVATRIGYVGFAFGALTFGALCVAWLAAGGHERTVEENGGQTWYQQLLAFFVVAITIVVVAVPEGLPLAVTLSLAFSMRRMAKDQNLVRNLAACETMGSATTICSDKTGTLTQNRMSVVKAIYNGESPVEAAKLLELLGEDNAREIAEAIALNSEATVRYEPPNPPEFIDNKTECAMLLMSIRDLCIDVEDIRRHFGSPFYREPFSSDRKRMTSIFQDGTTYKVYCKGAAEAVIDLCTRIRGPEGTRELTDEDRDRIKQTVLDLAGEGLRTLAVCTGSFEEENAPCGADVADEERDRLYREALKNGEVVEKDMELLTVVGIKDPLRPGVAEAVKIVQGAGVTVRMVTGDALPTARHIARECGILPEDDYLQDAETPGEMNTTTVTGLSTDAPHKTRLCMEGRDFRALPEAERRRILPYLAVLARSIPSDKLLLVQDLQALGEVVAVTGDGSNDAPALKQANVGLAMGIAGTEVAKEAADIIILDDNFRSIVRSVAWGRNVLECVQRFLCFQLAINFSSLLLTFVVACANEGDTSAFPLTPVQLLQINLIMDSFAALALATESPSPALLEQTPNGLSKPLISKILIKMIAGQGLWQFAFLTWMTFDTQTSKALFLVESSNPRELLTCIFNTFVWMQIANKFNARKIHDEANILEGFFESKFALAIIGIIIVLQIIVVEAGGDLMSTVPLRWDQWLICMALSLTTFPIGYLVRYIPYADDDDIIAKRQGVRADPEEARKEKPEISIAK